MDFSKENIHLISTWFRSSCLQIFHKIGVFENFAKFTGKYLCRSHYLTKLQVSRPGTLKRDSSTGILLCILCNFSAGLIYRTPPDNWSCWFLCSKQGFIHWSHLFVFPSFFTFIIVNCNYWSLFRKCIKMKILYFL